MESRTICGREPPLNFPRGTESTTVPVADAPCGMATWSPTETGCATVAVKVSPEWLDLVLRVLPRRTVMRVPAGTVTDLEVSRFIKLGVFSALGPLEFVASSAGGLLPQPRVTKRVESSSRRNAKRSRI